MLADDNRANSGGGGGETGPEEFGIITFVYPSRGRRVNGLGFGTISDGEVT